MASLYVKDHEANALAEELALRRGVTKTAAVKLALRHELARDAAATPTGRPLLAIMEEFWEEHPLGTPTGLEADKAFYDSLNDEDDD
ncbi:type II toxin-antitoxin system VapB family antitoxin [Sphingomonas sp.]|uniref:type II toxin-antitoxin system VapB family antitoxin n=1 Tax=Sphingomonas sp. TaxID=28214 RepID=UPI001D292B29|nr:type II toxin-antitoxin system VapB family antitoxin [Sphingomonas sp.]MBX9796686.1 type II toxin-antitoxin system VapB family antitoxin [Sphingomonas sp.]